jgi:hypothetical protein
MDVLKVNVGVAERIFCGKADKLIKLKSKLKLSSGVFFEKRERVISLSVE